MVSYVCCYIMIYKANKTEKSGPTITSGTWSVGQHINNRALGGAWTGGAWTGGVVALDIVGNFIILTLYLSL